MPTARVGELERRHVKSSSVAAGEHCGLDSVRSPTPRVGWPPLPSQAWWVLGRKSAWAGALGEGWALRDL